MNYIITKNQAFFQNVGNYKYCNLEDMILPEKIAIDTETTGLSPQTEDDMFCVQIGTGVNNYIFDLQSYNNPDLEYKFEELIPYIKDKCLVGQNLTFDLKFFYKHDFWPENVRDTFIASKILYNGEGGWFKHDFKSIMERELNLKYDKVEQKNIHKVKLSQPSTIEYSFNDVDKLLQLEEHLAVKLKNYGSFETYRLHCKYIRALAYMEMCGMPFNSTLWKAKMVNDLQVSKDSAKEIVEYIWEHLPQYRNNQLSLFDTDKRIKVNITSPKQMIPVFQAFGVNTKNKEGADSIEENVIRKSKHEFVKLWLKYQKAEHSVTTFGQNILDHEFNGRLYTSFNPIVDTARISTRKGGINFLNFPAKKEVRECFEAKQNFVMVVADMAAQEARICADLSRDPAMLNSVINGQDLHCMFARKLYPEIEEFSDAVIMSEYSDKRQSAKAPRFCFQYGGGGFTLATNANIPLKEAMKLEVAFKELHAGIYTWGDKVFKEAISKGYIESASGFKLKLPNFKVFKELDGQINSFSKEFWTEYRIGKDEYKKYWNSKKWLAAVKAGNLEEFSEEEVKENEKITSEYVVQNKHAYELYQSNKQTISEYFKLKSGYLRLCLNNPIQARAAHQIKLSTVMLFDFIVKNKHQWLCKICNIPHDEKVLEVADNLKELYKEKLAYFMIKAGNFYLTAGLFSMDAEAAIGSNWYSAKKG